MGSLFKLKYLPATSSSSLNTTSAPSSPCRPARPASVCALSALQEQRQRQRSSGLPVPSGIPRSRTTSLVPASVPTSPRRPPPPATTAKLGRKKQKPGSSQQAVSVAVEGSSMQGEASVVEDVEMEDIVPSSSRQSALLLDEDEEDLSSNGSTAMQNVVVCVRVRPAEADSPEDMWSMNAEQNRIKPTEHHPSVAKRSTGISSPSKKATAVKPISLLVEKEVADTGDGNDFQFDSLVLPTMTTISMYQTSISPIINAVVKGYNGTVFAYGQTGSGKTHTMSGSEAEKGVIPSAVEEVFVKVKKDSSREFLLRVSYLEIYNETLKDLLAPYPSSSSCTDLTARPSSPIKGGSSHVSGGSDTSLRIIEAGGRIQIQGLREEIVTNAGEVLNLLEWGQRGRHQAATDWNERSSRSHCVFILTLESREQGTIQDDVRFSQLNLIDLAGSERAATEKERRKEGAFINKSLLTLGTVIAKLSEQSQTGNEETHIPYRDSKLTRLLQTSLGGNARVAVVCTISPRKEHSNESLSTLRFGQRCKMVITKAKRGTIVNDKALIARYRKELERLRGQLENGSVPSADMSMDAASLKELQSQKAEAEKDVQTMNEKRIELKKQVEHLTRLILTGNDVAAADTSHWGAENKVVRRAARMSDLGTSSPSKRQKLFDDVTRHALSPIPYIDRENTMQMPSMKPFALESELSALRKNLAAAMAARQASEEARSQETQVWKARVMELESLHTEQEEELDEAEVAFEKLKSERDTLRRRVEEETEANRLLKLVAKSRGGEVDEAERKLLEQSEKEKDRLKAELAVETAAKAEMKTAQQDQMKEVERQLDALQQRLDEETAKTERLEALQSEHSSSIATPLEETAALQRRLEKTIEEKEHLQQELTSLTLERGQEDAERDFADLVKSTSNDEGKLLAKKDKQLLERAKEIETLKRELQEAHQKVKPLPVPSTAASPSLSNDLRSLLEQQLKVSEERCKALEGQIASLKKEAQCKGEDSEKRINLLEKQLMEAARVKLSRSPLRPDSLLEEPKKSSLQRGGSMREYKRYSVANELPSSNNVAIEQAVKAEREEIERLNIVINSQRTIMSDLEGSVAAWKNRLRLQHDIITRLVEAGGSGEKMVLPEELKAVVPPPSPAAKPQTVGGADSSSINSNNSLKRAASILSSHGSPVPYYGAHSYNRPPPAGLGLGSTSPTKGVAWLSTMPGVRPDPLPLPNGLSSPAGRAKRRITIEHEIEELKGSPRVRSTTDRLLDSTNCGQVSRPLPVPGSPIKFRPSKDYYI